MTKIPKPFNYHHIVNMTNLSSPIVNTSRTKELNITQAVNKYKPNYLNCLAPPMLGTANECNCNLAGNPRSANTFEGLRSEIVEKWNQRPKLDQNKEWNKSSVLL